MRDRMRRLPQLPPWITYALLGMIIVSLMLHGLTWLSIFQARQLIKAEVLGLADQIADAQDDTISADFTIAQRVPIDTEIPVQEQLTIPISTTVNIDDTVIIPFGGIDIPVPIQADVPIITTVPIAIDQTVRISTTVDLDLDVPIRLPIADTSLQQYLRDLEEQLRNVADRL